MLNGQSEKVDLSKVRTTREKVYLTLVIIGSVFIWVWIFYSIYQDFAGSQKIGQATLNNDGTIPTLEETQESVTNFYSSLSTPILLVIFFFVGLFFHLVSVAYIRVNAVKLGPEQFPKLWQSFEEEAKLLGMGKTPDVFIMLGQGAVNAFAVRLVFRRIIVFFAELADVLEEEKDVKQLKAVIAHELGHHLLGHTHILNLLLYAESIPFLGSALSRARERSSDRVMKALIGDEETCERAFIKLAAGRRFGSLANIEVFLNQRIDEGGFFAWFSEKLSSHPHLPNRIRSLREFTLATKE